MEMPGLQYNQTWERQNLYVKLSTHELTTPGTSAGLLKTLVSFESVPDSQVFLA